MSFGRKSNDNAERVALLRDSDSADEEDFFLKGPPSATDKVSISS